MGGERKESPIVGVIVVGESEWTGSTPFVDTRDEGMDLVLDRLDCGSNGCFAFVKDDRSNAQKRVNRGRGQN